MWRLATALIVALAMAAPAWPGSHGPSIRAVIEGQIAAFGAGDLGRAFFYASPTIRDMFGTPENFGRMVQEGYPMIWRPSDVAFLGLRTGDGTQLQRLRVRDANGQIHLFDYVMTAGPDGWRINGVYPVVASVAGV